MNPRKAPTQARSRAMVDTILEATARVLVRDGFARTTTTSVALCAGISPGSLYQYFGSKEALVAAVAGRQSEAVKRAMESRLAQGPGANLKESLQCLMSTVVTATSTFPELTAVLAREVPKLGKLDWQEENEERGRLLALTMLEQHRDQIRTGIDLHRAATLMATTIQSVLMREQSRSASETDLEMACSDLVMLFSSYLTHE